MDTNTTTNTGSYPSSTETTVYSLLITILTFIALVLHSISVLVFVLHKVLRTKEYLYYVALLSIVDWCNCIAYVVTLCYNILHPNLTALQCVPVAVFPPSMMIACCLATICLTLDRYIAISMPLKHRAYDHKRNLCYTCITIVIISLLPAVCVLLV
jgi:hypothetical protein